MSRLLAFRIAWQFVLGCCIGFDLLHMRSTPTAPWQPAASLDGLLVLLWIGLWVHTLSCLRTAKP